MKKSLYLLASLLVLTSCAKEEFAINKGLQSSSANPITTSSTKVCSQHTLISPKVDILMLWDNSSSFNFVTTASKNSMTKLIESVSENFDYHILSLPLVVPASTSSLYEGILVAKDSASVSGSATSILKTKEEAVASLTFSPEAGSNERGVDRATKIIEDNRSNGIFRDGAYTIIVLMSNEDDKGCEMDTKFASCTSYDRAKYLAPKKTKLLCLRGNTTENCDSSGVSSPLNSAMMRFITIAPLTACSSGFNKMNASYREVSKTLYEASYTNGWPTSNDHLSPDVSGAPDSYNLCSIDFSHIFDGVNTAIKQTLIKHKYEFWPVANLDADIDPATLRVVRTDGKILKNYTCDDSQEKALIADESDACNASPSNGFKFIGNQNNHITRTEPTSGEPFTGTMIQLFGSDGNDRLVYPDCLTVTYSANKVQYGYVYLANGVPKVDSLDVRITGVVNGVQKTNEKIPNDAVNGYTYMGWQNIPGALDQKLKIFNYSGASSGPMLQLNGIYKVHNNSNSKVTVDVYYNSAQ